VDVQVAQAPAIDFLQTALGLDGFGVAVEERAWPSLKDAEEGVATISADLGDHMPALRRG
jgi:hypothetical protein